MNRNKSNLSPEPEALPTDLMRMKEAAAFVRRSIPSMYRDMAKRGLPARRLGGCWVFSRAELEAWVKGLPGINVQKAS